MATEVLLSPERVHASAIRCALFGALGIGIWSILRVFGPTHPAAIFWVAQAAAGAAGGYLVSRGPRTGRGVQFALAGLPASLIYIAPWYASKVSENPLFGFWGGVLFVSALLAGHAILGIFLGIAEGKSRGRKTTMAIAGVIGIPVGILFALPSWPVLNAGFVGAYAVLAQGLFGAGLGAALGTGLWLLDRKGP